MATNAELQATLGLDQKAIVPAQKSIDTSDASSEEDAAVIRERILQEKLENSQPPVLPIMTLFNRKKDDKDLDQVATQPSVYDDPTISKYFIPSEKYENLHRFDPEARWTWREELANTDNFLGDLGLNTNDFNLGNTVFRLSFLCAELPSQLISKKLGPDRWIPTIMCLWSIVAASQFWLSGRTSFLVCRALLGVLQGGFIPDTILYLSYFFKGTELPFRLALFWTTLRVTDIIAPILALGLLQLRGFHGYEGWRWLFLFEGLLTLVIGIMSWFMMAPGPTQTKSWFRPKGWYSEREETIMVNRILRDDPSKGDMHNRQAVDLKLLWKSICDYDLWPIYILGLTFQFPYAPPDQYLTLTLRNLGFDTFDSNLLSIPNQVVGAVTMMLVTYYSERLNERSLIGVFCQTWVLPNIIALTVLPNVASAWARFAILTVLLSVPSAHAMQVGWCSRNSNTVRTRTVSAALYNMLVQVSGIAYSNVYRADDRPFYRKGNRILVGINVLNLFLYVFVKFYYVWRNKKRDQEWNGMTKEEQIHYLANTKDSGSKRKDFRFAH